MRRIPSIKGGIGRPGGASGVGRFFALGKAGIAVIGFLFLFAVPVMAEDAQPPAPQTSNTPDPKPPIVKEIELQYYGPATVTREELLANIGTRVGEAYDQKVVEQDIRTIYGTGRIHNVRIFGKPLVDGVKIIIVLQCRPKISEIRIQGVTPSAEKALRRKIGFTTDILFDGPTMAAEQQQIIDYYTRKGFGFVEVDYSADFDGKLGAAKLVFSIHNAPDDETDTQTESGDSSTDSQGAGSERN